MKGNAARPPIARGDHVYVRHPTKGVAAVRVLAVGKDGLTGRCDAGKRHAVPWKHVLGVRKRLNVLAPRERPEPPPPPASMAKAAPAAEPVKPAVPPPPPPSAAERRLAERLQAIDRAARAAEWARWSKRPPAPPPPPHPPAPRAAEESRRREPLWHSDDAGHFGYFDFRNRMATDLRAGIVHAEPEAMIAHVADRANTGQALAAEWTERFLADADRHLERRRR
jgi:RimJ/RimL family protein N-acetyltransferase